MSGLTDAERELLHEGVCTRHRDTTPGVYVCGPCESAGDAAVETLITARVAAERERIAQAIEAVRSPSLSATEIGHLDHAARIARSTP